jgi:ketosteroid isomerase-like protein
VLALVNVTGRGAASGLPVSMHAASIIRLRDGEVTGIESHPDLATAREALTRR